MPARLGDIAKIGRKSVHIDLEEAGDLNLDVFPNRMTMELQSKATEATDKGDEAALSLIFCHIVDSWDVLDDEGKVLPLNAKSVSQIGVQTLGVIMEEVTNALRPKSGTLVTTNA